MSDGEADPVLPCKRSPGGAEHFQNRSVHLRYRKCRTVRGFIFDSGCCGSRVPPDSSPSIQQTDVEPAMAFTRVLMMASASYLGALGLVASFAPDVLLGWLEAPSQPSLLAAVQVLGALYVGFGGLNWMARENLIGGIYSRPVVIGNLMHFLTASLAVLKAMASAGTAGALWGIAVPYTCFAVAFGVVLFRHPIAADGARLGRAEGS